MLIKNEYKPSMLPKTAKAKKPITSDGRISLVLWLIAAAFVGLLARGIYLQTTQHEFLKNQGDQRFVRTLTLPASRGMITDHIWPVRQKDCHRIADQLHWVPARLRLGKSETMQWKSGRP